MQSFRLKALDSFHCLGGDCPFTCCKGWEITLNPEIVAKWETLEPGAFKQGLLAAIERNPAAHQEILSMHRSEDGACIMLDETGLCNIHKQTEELLPATCRDYPRIACNYGMKKLATANLSCPEIVRLVLAANTTDQFQISEDGFPSPVELGGLAGKIGQQLENFTNLVLAEQRFSLAVRIAGIAEILVRLEQKRQQGILNLPEVQRLCAKPRQHLYELNQKTRLRHFRPQPALAGRFWKFIVSALGTPDAQAYFDRTITQNEFVQRAIAAQTDVECTALYEEILGYRNSAFFELSEANQLYGEKYLSVKFANSGFPATPTGGNFIATFLYCIFPFALIQLLLWLQAAQKGKVSDESVLSMISRSERMLGHNDHIYLYLQQNTAALRLDLYYQCLMDL